MILLGLGFKRTSVQKSNKHEIFVARRTKYHNGKRQFNVTKTGIFMSSNSE